MRSVIRVDLPERRRAIMTQTAWGAILDGSNFLSLSCIYRPDSGLSAHVLGQNVILCEQSHCGDDGWLQCLAIGISSKVCGGTGSVGGQ